MGVHAIEQSQDIVEVPHDGDKRARSEIAQSLKVPDAEKSLKLLQRWDSEKKRER